MRSRRVNGQLKDRNLERQTETVLGRTSPCAQMPALKWAALAGLVALLNACGSLHSAKMLSPAFFGMDEVSPTLYVEPGMPPEQRQGIQQQIELGRAQVERFYGAITTRPYFVACATNDCAVRFGSFGERATAFGESAIRLSPNGLAAPLVAHEWSHAEVYRRAGGLWRIRGIPRWFDEGVAVVVADEARHSEANWREIQQRRLATPPLTELVSRQDWTAAVRKYGETKPDDPDNLRVVYSTAGHEVRAWISCAGPSAVVALLSAVNEGEAFDAAYTRLGRACRRNAAEVLNGKPE